jgi:S-adenosylhomocysteine hydrolase
MRALGAKVTLLDTDGDALDKAHHEKFPIQTDHQKFFSKQDIVIGATGVQSITAEDIGYLKDGAIIGSASSKLVEIDVDALAAGDANPAIVDGKSHPPSVRYDLGGRKVTLLARGFPLNFDGEAENIPPEQIQLTRALMVLGLLQATQSKVAGVRRLDPKMELALLQKFDELGGGDASPEIRKALDEAVEALQGAIAHPGTRYRRHGVE